MTGTCSRSASARARLQRRRVERIHRVRRHGRRDQVVGSELLDERLRPRQPFGRCLRVRNRKLDDRLPEHAAKPGFARRARDLLLEVVHVGVRGRPRLDHLERGEPRAGPHELGRDGLRLGRERCTSAASPSAPDRPPGPRYSTIGACVWVLTSPGITTWPAGVDGLPPLEAASNRVRCIDGDDVAAVDRHRPWIEHPRLGEPS